MPPFVRGPYNYDRDAASVDAGLACLDASRTVQSPKDEVDINTIVRRFGLTGRLPMSVRPPQFGDFVGVNDYQTALNALRAAERSFMSLPSAVRSRFQNSPQALMEFLSDPGNRDEAVKLGLIEAPPPPPAAGT